MTHRTVSDVMTNAVQSAYVRTPVKTIAERLDWAGVTAMPVLDDDAEVVGVVSEADLLHKVTYQDDADGWPRLLRRHRTDRDKAEGLLAQDVMTAPAITIAPGASVVEAAQLLERHRVKRLPVVNDTGKLVGVVSRADLVRLLTRPDDEILEEVRADVIGRVLLSPEGVAVGVSDGVVTLTGTLPRRSQIGIAVEFARRVDGVIEVVDALTYTEDDTAYRALRAEVDGPVGPYL
ncbi:CBS domain-containing protein [Cryptosporangium sp. NPDC051539]|uniref:CBS domain-containing protein n=1 Tax=Cryptosporangium sp. NPDC051539 TaxID=3363962 RepID=UPI0037AC2F1B